MGNHKLEHHQFWINTIPPIISEAAIIETWKQHVGIRVIQSLDTSITTIRVETVVAPNIYVVTRWVLIGSTTKLGNKLNGISAKRNLNWNTTLSIITIGVVGTPQVVFTNPIMIIHVNRNLSRPSMSSMVVGRYKNVDATNLGWRYQ
jgi:hypothetical protein